MVALFYVIYQPRTVWTMRAAALGLPILLITLAVRIVEEERAMRQTFADYRGIMPDRIRSS